MASYLTLATYKTRTLAPADYVDEIETAEAGWPLAKLTSISAMIDGLLRKRYAAPFTVEPYPEVVLNWLTEITDELVFLKRGVDAGDEQFIRISARADRAWNQIHEAADARDGLYDLPLKQDDSATGISKGAVKYYSEAGPYAWATNQRDNADNDEEP